MDQIDYNNECPVCYDKFKSHIVLLMGCNHSLCFDCFDSFRKLNIQKCPLCRYEINEILIMPRKIREIRTRTILVKSNEKKKIWWFW